MKYTGGKYKEYDKIKPFLPERINNYYEPFFGGGGVYFRLNEDNLISGKSHINDLSKNLIEFYMSISGDTLQTELYRISDEFDAIKEIGEDIYVKFKDRFGELLTSKEKVPFVNDEISIVIGKAVTEYGFNTHGFSLSEKIEKSLNDKLVRMQRKQDISGDTDSFIHDCITTSVCQAYYFIIRDMYNDWNNHGNIGSYSMEERSAQWAFIREFCFGSMFRFSNGDYNVPYGGCSYNKKNFRAKIENIVSDKAKELFRNTEIRCEDFERVMDEWRYEKDDFIFLDPPYDSTFSEYEGISFQASEHQRLADCLGRCDCKWLMAIGKTDFICDLYKGYDIIEYEKTYMYQARNTYDNKHTLHLIIKNY